MQEQSLIPSFEDTKLHSVDLVSNTEFSTLSSEIKAFKTLANPMLCDEKYLPFLAYAFKVDFWDEELDVKDKRELIKFSILLHQKKGTVWAIEQIFKALNINARVEEWFEYAGNPYYFKVELFVFDKPITEETIVKLEKYINIFKNARSILESLYVTLTSKCKQNFASNIQLGEIATLYPYQLTEIEFNPVTNKNLSALQSVETLYIYPQGA